LFENEHYKFFCISSTIIENITYFIINQKFNQQQETSNQQLELIRVNSYQFISCISIYIILDEQDN